MPVLCIFEVWVVRCQIETATEPPHRVYTFVVGMKETYVHVGRGNVRVSWMKHQREPHRFETLACQICSAGGGGGGQGVAADYREVDTGLFEQISISEQAAFATASFIPVPTGGLETGRTIFSLKGDTDAVLKIE